MTSTDTPHSHNASQDLNANIVSTLDNGKAMERAINTEATWLFNGNIEVVTADQMLKQHFSKSELLAEADKQPILETLVRYLGEVDLSTIEDERHMYQPLAEKITSCLAKCDPNKYKCIRTASSPIQVGTPFAMNVKKAPDLIITPDKANDVATTHYFTCGAVLGVEVKFKKTLDPRFGRGKVPESEFLGRVTNGAGLSNDQKALIKQLMIYAIYGQFVTLPYHFIFFIVITSDVARIWKLSPTGVLVTQPIEYTNAIKCEPLARFLYAVGSSPATSIGLNVGEGMMFQELCLDEKDSRRMQAIRDLYVQESSNFEWKKEMANHPEEYWIFDLEKQCNSSGDRSYHSTDKCKRLVIFPYPIYHSNRIFCRATRCYLGVDYDFLTSNFTTINKTQAQTQLQKMHTFKTAWQFTRQIPEYQFHMEFATRFADKTIEPISAESTRVATVIAGGVIANSEQIGGRILSHISSSQNPTPSQPECDPDQDSPTIQAESNQTEDDSNISYATRPKLNRKSKDKALVYADSESSSDELMENQHDTDRNPFQVDESIVPSQTGSVTMINDPKRHPRELHWLVYKELGGNISSVENVKEFAQVLVDTISAHRYLFENGILHRDISVNNVMVDLTTRDLGSTRRGLLIDLDMAMFIPKGQDDNQTEAAEQQPSISNKSKAREYTSSLKVKGDGEKRPEITGTLLFMAVGLREGPVHVYWFDIESFCWLADYGTLRHLKTIKHRGTDISGVIARANTIKDVFPYSNLDQISTAKRQFLRSSIEVPECLELDTALQKCHTTFDDLYLCLENIDSVYRGLATLERALDQTHTPNNKYHYQAEDLADLLECIDDLDRHLQNLKDICIDATKDKYDTLREIVRKTRETANSLAFPTYKLILSYLERVAQSDRTLQVKFVPYNHPIELSSAKSFGRGPLQPQREDTTSSKQTRPRRRWDEDEDYDDQAKPHKRHHPEG